MQFRYVHIKYTVNGLLFDFHKVAKGWIKWNDCHGDIYPIRLLSGFYPDVTSIGNVAGLKRVERRGRNVVVYFDELSHWNLFTAVAAD